MSHGAQLEVTINASDLTLPWQFEIADGIVEFGRNRAAARKLMETAATRQGVNTDFLFDRLSQRFASMTRGEKTLGPNSVAFRWGNTLVKLMRGGVLDEAVATEALRQGLERTAVRSPHGTQASHIVGGIYLPERSLGILTSEAPDGFAPVQRFGREALDLFAASEWSRLVVAAHALAEVGVARELVSIDDDPENTLWPVVREVGAIPEQSVRVNVSGFGLVEFPGAHSLPA